MAWKPVQKQSVIEIIAPASKCSIGELESGIAKLEAKGFKVKMATDIFAEHPFCAQSDAYRLKALSSALKGKDSDLIWCVRGGYGSHRLLPKLLKLAKPSRIKPFLGLSDLTAIHSFLNEKWGWPSLHAPILSRIGKGDLPDASITELFNLIQGQQPEVVFQNLIPMNTKAKSTKKIVARVLGGNLATYLALFGTAWQPKMKNSILFLEDIGERGYKLDRLLFQLQSNVNFKNVKAIVFGDFTDGLEPDGSDLKWNALNAWAESLKIPVFKGAEVGHGNIQRVLPLGTKSLLDLKKRELRVSSGCSPV